MVRSREVGIAKKEDMILACSSTSQNMGDEAFACSLLDIYRNFISL